MCFGRQPNISSKLETLESVVQFWSKSWQVQRSRRPDVSVSIWRQEKTNVQLKQTSRGVLSSSWEDQHVCSPESFGWMMAIRIRGAISFISITKSRVISSKTTLTDTPRIMCDQISGPPVAQIGWHKINHRSTINFIHDYFQSSKCFWSKESKSNIHLPDSQLDHKCDRKTFHQLPLQICMCSAINKYVEHIQIRYKLTCLWTLIKTQNHRTIGFQNWRRPQNSLDECTHPS